MFNSDSGAGGGAHDEFRSDANSYDEAGGSESLTGADSERILIDKSYLRMKKMPKYRTELLDGLSEGELVQLACKGNESACNRLIGQNLKTIRKNAARYCGKSVGGEYQDLVQQGMIGLLKAIKKFDQRKGVSFAVYAKYWIRTEILRYIYKHGGCIRQPESVLLLRKFLRKCEASLSVKIGRTPSCEEIATAAGLTEKQITELKNFDQVEHVSSLDSLLDDPDNGTEVSAAQDSQPAYLAEANGRREFVISMLSVLTPRQREVMVHLYGLNNGSEMTLEAVGVLLGTSRQSVHQVQNSALIKLKKKFGKVVDQFFV